ncbi:ser/Thr protein phosphatase [Moelleriella libera RCEF 2490]|uniref:Ser/Thr protein phosphatase n=1 Tax=Moelleriella libera RCEF 2490 TaxID=1081109 RepID=A0A162IML0_9HYPO|nr:ser/Thr protein phosphatase [Moelleriella libera RCEF 2490]
MWESIPDDADLVVTHTPPRGHCDATLDQRPGGCEALRRALWRVRPLLSVCGHIHDGRGAERVQWKEEADSMHDLQPQRFAEKSVFVWDDPGAGNNRMSLLDLTGRKGAAKLQPKETCIVNCAIMKSKYPHPGGKTFNKPVVVDIDLPIWPID